MDLGAEDVNGNTIIPIQNKYRRLLYIRGYFEVVDQRKKNIGVYDKNGNEKKLSLLIEDMIKLFLLIIISM